MLKLIMAIQYAEGLGAQRVAEAIGSRITTQTGRMRLFVPVQRGLTRRMFLRLNAISVAAVLAACVAAGRERVGDRQQGIGHEPEAEHITAMEEKMGTGLTIRNDALVVTLHTTDGVLSVVDKRTGDTWTQRPVSGRGALLSAEGRGRVIRWTWRDVRSGLDLQVTAELEGNRPELVLAIVAEGEFAVPIAFPHPFVTERGTYLVVPMNEGISYPVEDETIEPMRLIAYGGHGICMSFFGATDGQRGMMALIETPDDAAIRIERLDGMLCITPEWDSQKGHFGYPRKLRYVFFDRGGHVGFCKYYRNYAQAQRRFKTLAEKRAENPNVDLLIGAVNVWCWERPPVLIATEMRALGMHYALWSECNQPDDIRSLNELGYLTSTYDIYQDVMNPEIYPKLQWIHPRWPEKAWPKDLMLGPDGDWIKGWEIETKDGGMYPCGVTCDRQAPPYARERTGRELQTLPYTCRFIDTTTATPWRECYHPDHPLTRSESREWKMRLLQIVSEEMHLVTGTETGHDAAVPYVHYFEGMLSLGPYRVPDAGRDMQRIWDEVPDLVGKFQMGHRYRLPLWELVYHDCVLAHWYWGDYSNKLSTLWDKRDLFNVLYGTAPMFMFDRDVWQRYQERFVQSYRTVCPVARAVGYAEMTDHRFLTGDRDVQQTVYANGVTVTVNFSDQEYLLADGTRVGPMGYNVRGI